SAGCEEPERQAAAGTRHDGRERAALEHPAPRQRADQGEQGLRPADAAESQPQFRQRTVHGSTPLGLFRQEPARRGTTSRTSNEAARGGRARLLGPFPLRSCHLFLFGGPSLRWLGPLQTTRVFALCTAVASPVFVRERLLLRRAGEDLAPLPVFED